MSYTMQPLRLSERTSPAWLERALGDLSSILLDHAHCEFVALALHYADEQNVMSRLRELMDHEAEVLSRPPELVRLHT